MMKLSEILINCSIEYQNLKIKSSSIQITYFFLRNILEIPIISLLFLNSSSLFSNVLLVKDIINYININNQSSLTFQRIFIILYIILIFILIILKLKYQNKTIQKIFYLFIIFLEAINNIGCYFLLINILNQKQILLVRILSTLIFIPMQILLVLRDRILISLEGFKNNILSHNANKKIFMLNLLQKTLFTIITIVLKYNYSQQLTKNLFYSILLVIYSIKIIIFLKEKYYIEQISNNLSIFGCIMSLTLLFINQIYLVTQEVLIMQNICLLTLTIIFLSTLSIFSYSRFIQNQLIYKSLQEVIQTKNIQRYIQSIFKLWKNRQQAYFQSIILSFKKNHENDCSGTSCKCRDEIQAQYKLQQINIKRLKGQNLNKSSKNNQNKSYQQYNKTLVRQKNITQQRDKQQYYFLRYYIKQNLNKLYLMVKDKNAKIQILCIWLQLFNDFIDINHKLNKLENDSTLDHQTIIQISILKDKIKQIIQRRNCSSTISTLQILKLEQKILAMEDIIIDEIRIKAEKWKYLSQSICRSLDIQNSILRQIQNIIKFDKIYSENKHCYKRSLSFNALSLFYYNQIIFLRHQYQNITKNMIQISSNIKQTSFHNEKQIQKKIFNQNCCLIQFNIESNQTKNQFQLNIKNCNKNTFHVFLCKEKQKLIGKSLKKIFPEFIVEDYKEKIFANFNQKQILEKTEIYYFVDYTGAVFQALLCVKIISTNSILSCVFIILQLRVKKLILVNKKGYIQNVGKDFISYFGKYYKNLPLSCIFYNQQEYNSLKMKQRQQKKTFLLFNGINLKHRWDLYIQNISEYIRKEKIESILKINNSKNSLSLKDAHIVGNASKRQYDKFLINQKRQLIKRQQQIIKKSSNRTFQSQELNSVNNQFVMNATISYKKDLVNEKIFYVVSFQEITKLKNPSKKTLLYQKAYQNKFTHKNIEEEYELNDYLQKVDDLNESNQSQSSKSEIQFQNQFQENDNAKLLNKKQNFIIETSSINSSLKTQNVLNSNSKFIQICINLFKNPNQIDDKTLKTFVLSSSLTSVLISCLIIASYVVFKLLLLEVKDIFFADGAVSDNMQLTLFMLNRAMNFNTFSNNSSMISNMKISSNFERQYLYSLIVYNHKKYETQITSMTKTKFYQYLRVPIKWRSFSSKYINNQNNSMSMNKISSDAVQIQTYQFLQYYYQLSREVQLNVINAKNDSQKIIRDSLQLMKINFPQLKRINHYNLYLYKKMSDQSLQLLQKLILILYIAHLALFIVFFAIFYKQKMFRRSQQIQGYSIYKIIPKNTISIVSNYYQNHLQNCKHRKDLLKYQTYFQSQPLVMPKQLTIFKNANACIFVSNNVHTPSIIWKTLVIIIILNTAYMALILNLRNLIGPIKLMMNNVNQLMDSENYLIQAHIELKANFLIQGQIRTDIQFYDYLLSSQTSSDVIFNRIAVSSLNLFSQYQPNYTSDFIELLINDTCQLAKQQLSPQLYNKCKQFFKINFIQDGVIMGMNFFTRKVRQTISYIKQQIKSMNGTNFSQEMINSFRQMFKSQDFIEIDESMFFMFKLYQGTQARIYQSLQKIIIQETNQIFMFVLFEIVLLSIVYNFLLFVHYHKQKFQLSKLYVSFLLIPTPILKNVKDFTRKIQQILKFSHD